jgi:hypothetical protein
MMQTSSFFARALALRAGTLSLGLVGTASLRLALSDSLLLP